MTKQKKEKKLLLWTPSSAATTTTTRRNDLQEWLQQVEWLDPLPEMDNNTNNTTEDDDDNKDDDDTTVLPFFSLSGRMFPNGNKIIFLSFPNSRMFQYQEWKFPSKSLNHDIDKCIMTSFSSHNYSIAKTHPTSLSTMALPKCLVVPFCHPYQPGQFAKFGWLYQIMPVQDVADETNRRLHIVCNHLVTKPVQIHSIVNPCDYQTQSTKYLRARVTLLDNDDDKDSTTTPICFFNVLGVTRNEDVGRAILLMALAEGGICPVTRVWILPPPKTTTEEGRPIIITNEMILAAQEPHKEVLKSMLMEVTTLAPLLLQDLHKKDSLRLFQRMQERLGS
jgi:hypothetical protein